MDTRRFAYDLTAVLAASLVLLACMFYVSLYPNFDVGTLVVGVVIPLTFGSVVLAARKNWVLLFAFLAYFWSLVEDGPVFFDSVFTWPEVTRFHPAGPHIFMEVLVHLATIAFLYLAIKEAAKGRRLTASKVATVSILVMLAFILSYAQNIPLAAIQAMVSWNWYALDLLEHIASLGFFYFALTEAQKSPRNLGEIPGLSNHSESRGPLECFQ